MLSLTFAETRMFGSDAVYLFLKLRRQVQANGGRIAFCNTLALRLGNSHLYVTRAIVANLPNSRAEAMTIVERRAVDILVVDDSEVDRRANRRFVGSESRLQRPVCGQRAKCVVADARARWPIW